MIGKFGKFGPKHILNAAYKAAYSHKDKDGFTRLMRAARDNDLKKVNTLLSNKGEADIDTKNNAGDTALIIAVNNGYTDVVKVLLQHD